MDSPLTEIEKNLRDKINGKTIVEKYMGRYWEFEFDDVGFLKCLYKISKRTKEYTKKSTYSRCKPGLFGDSEEINFPTFCKHNDDDTYDCIFLVRVYDPYKRTDHVVVSGFECSDMQPGDETTLFAKPTIAWKIHKI